MSGEPRSVVPRFFPVPDLHTIRCGYGAAVPALERLFTFILYVPGFGIVSCPGVLMSFPVVYFPCAASAFGTQQDDLRM